MATQASASMTVTQQLVANIEAADTEGNPTDPNTVVWTSSDESVAVVVPQPGGLKCNIIAGAPGSCKVVVNANAGKGTQGTKPVLGVLNLTVTSGDVAEVKITTEKPVEQGTAPDQGLPIRPNRPSHRDYREASRELTTRCQVSRTIRQPEFRPTLRVSRYQVGRQTDPIRDCPEVSRESTRDCRVSRVDRIRDCRQLHNQSANRGGEHSWEIQTIQSDQGSAEIQSIRRGAIHVIREIQTIRMRHTIRMRQRKRFRLVIHRIRNRDQGGNDRDVGSSRDYAYALPMREHAKALSRGLRRIRAWLRAREVPTVVSHSPARRLRVSSVNGIEACRYFAK